MFQCEAAGTTARHLEDLAVFVSQLAALGLAAGVDTGGVPPDLTRNAQFDLLPWLCEGETGPVVVTGAQTLPDTTLTRLRRMNGRPCLAFGAFESDQALIGARARLAFAFGQEPALYNTLGPPAGEQRPTDAPVFGVPRRGPGVGSPRLLLIAPDLSDPGQAAALVALALSRQIRTAVLTDGKSKQDWAAAHGADIPFYHYGEILPFALAERVDICVCFAPARNGYRLRTLLANLAVSGAALIDGTRTHEIARQGDAFIRGPIDLGGIGAFVASDILPNLVQIGAHTRAAKQTALVSASPVLRFLGAAPRPRISRATAPRPGRVVFMPTNGVGLGHAQRCGLVARALDPERTNPVFAAFPSCARLIKSYGFDVMPLIGRSAHHAQSHENDLANALRLRALTAEAGALVFDGGYVFDSVYRAIVENRLRGIWVRRGLWQAAQDNSVALDREKIFDRVIVPTEAFDELNAAYSRGDQLREVGPIVQRIDLGAEARADLRARLAERFGIAFRQLVVTQLGAGVAADRGNQIQALAAQMARRPDVLHLVVVWPTATLSPVWLGWPNTRVVRTHFAGTLALAADVCVSAAGYNSFHEALYNRVPTIFVPQMGAFMDDQRARARAARERGLAAMVEAHALMTLEQELARFLDAGRGEELRARLAELELPEPGTARAARLIEEMLDGPAGLDFDSVADRPAGRR